LSEIPISDHLPLHTYCFEHLAEFADGPCLIIGSTGKTYSFAETHLHGKSQQNAKNKKLSETPSPSLDSIRKPLILF
jgi:hypothetical protein